MSDVPPPVPPVGAGSVPPPPTSQPIGQPSSAQPAGYGQQPAYGQPVAYGQPAYGYAQPTNTLAIVALVLGLSGFLFFITGIGGIICGHIALAQIKRTGENGRGMALAGVIVGYVSVGLLLLLILGYVIFFIVFLGAFAAAGAGSSY